MHSPRRVVADHLAVRLWLILRDRPDAYQAEELARELGVSAAHLERALQELEDAGLIRLEVKNED